MNEFKSEYGCTASRYPSSRRALLVCQRLRFTRGDASCLNGSAGWRAQSSFPRVH